MKLIVACSGGPDSMALLDILRKENINLAVAHVNYQKRDTAFRDEKLLVEYCEKYGIDYRILKPIYDHSKNFQAWARDVRYDFFERVCDEFCSKDIYVAHHMDDHIETYLFQKQRDMLCDWYGLKTELVRNGYRIHRPLLGYTKKELEEYCIQNGVSYGIDESNLTDDYTRNKIRHSVIDGMSKAEKLIYCDKINEENRNNQAIIQEIELYLKDFKIDELLKRKDNWRCLDMYLYQNIGHHFSKKYCLDLCEKLKKDVLIEIDGYDVERFHDVLYCMKQKELLDIVLETVEYGNYDFFELKDNGRTIEGITVTDLDFPIHIRCVKSSDAIQLRFGKKNVHRFFVDRKIPKHIRKYWLVVENKNKNVIFVPQIGCDVEHFSVKPNLFMIQ